MAELLGLGFLMVLLYGLSCALILLSNLLDDIDDDE